MNYDLFLFYCSSLNNAIKIIVFVGVLEINYEKSNGLIGICMQCTRLVKNTHGIRYPR